MHPILILSSDDSDEETTVVRAEKKQMRGGLVAKVRPLADCSVLQSYQVSSPLRPLPTAITHVMIVLELQSLRYCCYWNSCELCGSNT